MERTEQIGVYIHIPFCTAKCAYCDFASFSANKNLQSQYVAALIDEIENAPGGLTADTIFIGGGTPSALYRGGLTEIYDTLKAKFNLAVHTMSDITCKNPYTMSDITSKNGQKTDKSFEFTVEANPESCDEEFVKECVKIGVNRLSLGLQTGSDSLLKKLRRHTYGDFVHAVSLARKHGIININADLMLGLPGQTSKDIKDSVEKLKNLNLPHISVYALKVEEGTLLYKSGYKPDDDVLAEYYDLACQTLCENPAKILSGKENSANILCENQNSVKDYRRYEVSNFCLPGYECRHNQKYWRLQPYIGLGLNASSCYGGFRIKNTADVNRYLNRCFVESKESAAENFVTEYVMLSLRTSDGIDLDILKEKGIDLLLNSKVRDYIKKNVLLIKENKLIIAQNYFYVMNSVIADII